MAFRPNHVPSCWPPHFAVRAGRGLLHARPLTSVAVHGLLRFRLCLSYIDRRFDSPPNTLTPRTACRLLRIRFAASRCVRIAPRSALESFRTGYRLLCTRHIAGCAALRIGSYPDCSAIELLRGSDCSGPDTYRPTPLTDCSAIGA